MDAVETRICKRCTARKSVEEFHIVKKTGKRYIYCRACTKAYNKAYYEQNKNRIYETCRAYAKKNKEKVREYNIRYRIKNKDKRKESTQKWLNANRAYHTTLVLANQQRRRPPEGFDKNAAILRLSMFEGLCEYCRRPASTVEHRIPLSRGGGWQLANLSMACEQCNKSKLTKTPREFKEYLRVKQRVIRELDSRG